MTEHDAGTDRGRLAAHERLSSGALASWMRACANHPWRVMITWVGIIAGLILLVATVGGSLKDEFSIPGSETQKATDLIEAEFAAEQGGVLNLVFAAPEGERLDEPAARKAAIVAAIAKLRTPEFAAIGPDERAGVESVGDPFSENTFSEDGRIAYAEAQFDRVIYDKDREDVLAVQEAVREGVAPRRRGRRVQRRRRVPADRAGHAGASRPARRAHRAARRLPHARRDGDPAGTGDRRAHDGVPAPLHPRRPHRHQHDHAAARVHDRPRRRHRLLAVHRHPLPAAAPRRAVPSRRRRRGRCIGRPSDGLRRTDRRHLGDGPRVLRDGLHHEARHRLGARRSHHGVDRQLAADRRSREAGSQGRSAQGAVPAQDRRLGGGARADAHRPLGSLRDRARARRLRRRAARAARRGRDVGARAPRRFRPGHAAK